MKFPAFEHIIFLACFAFDPSKFGLTSALNYFTLVTLIIFGATRAKNHFYIEKKIFIDLNIIIRQV